MDALHTPVDLTFMSGSLIDIVGHCIVTIVSYRVWKVSVVNFNLVYVTVVKPCMSRIPVIFISASATDAFYSQTSRSYGTGYRP